MYVIIFLVFSVSSFAILSKKLLSWARIKSSSFNLFLSSSFKLDFNCNLDCSDWNLFLNSFHVISKFSAAFSCWFNDVFNSFTFSFNFLSCVLGNNPLLIRKFKNLSSLLCAFLYSSSISDFLESIILSGSNCSHSVKFGSGSEYSS